MPERTLVVPCLSSSVSGVVERTLNLQRFRLCPWVCLSISCVEVASTSTENLRFACHVSAISDALRWKIIFMIEFAVLSRQSKKFRLGSHVLSLEMHDPKGWLPRKMSGFPAHHESLQPAVLSQVFV
jgi:hypothetical protein